jgi:hypothetical protein
MLWTTGSRITTTGRLPKSPKRCAFGTSCIPLTNLGEADLERYTELSRRELAANGAAENA